MFESVSSKRETAIGIPDNDEQMPTEQRLRRASNVMSAASDRTVEAVRWGTKWLNSQSVWRKQAVSSTQNTRPAVVKVCTMSRTKGMKLAEKTIEELPDPIGEIIDLLDEDDEEDKLRRLESFKSAVVDPRTLTTPQQLQHPVSANPMSVDPLREPELPATMMDSPLYDIAIAADISTSNIFTEAIVADMDAPKKKKKKKVRVAEGDDDASHSDKHKTKKKKKKPLVRTRWIHVVGYCKQDVEILQRKYCLHELTAHDLAAVPQRSMVGTRRVVFGLLRGADITFDHIFVCLLNDSTLLTCVAASATVDVHETTAAWYDDMIESLKLIPSQPVASGRVAVELAKSMVTSVWHQVLILVQQVENVTNDHDNAERTKTAQIGTSAQSLMESQKALDRLERRHTRVWQRVAHDLKRHVHAVDGGQSLVFWEHFAHQIDEMNNLAETTRSHARTMVDMLSQDINLRMSSTLFVLSLVSVIFLPLTFVAGVYGMNFVDIPELNWSWGYMYFWFVEFTMLVATLAFLYWIYK